MTSRVLYWAVLLVAVAANVFEDYRQRTIPGMCIPTGCCVDWWFLPAMGTAVVLIVFGLYRWLT